MSKYFFSTDDADNKFLIKDHFDGCSKKSGGQCREEDQGYIWASYGEKVVGIHG